MTSPQVRPLLNNDFAPVTFRFGFVVTSFSSLCDAFHEWLKKLVSNTPKPQTEFPPPRTPPTPPLLHWEPEQNPSDRKLTGETNPRGRPLLARGLPDSDGGGRRGFLPPRRNRRSVEV